MFFLTILLFLFRSISSCSFLINSFSGVSVHIADFLFFRPLFVVFRGGAFGKGLIASGEKAFVIEVLDDETATSDVIVVVEDSMEENTFFVMGIFIGRVSIKAGGGGVDGMISFDFSASAKGSNCLFLVGPSSSIH